MSRAVVVVVATAIAGCGGLPGPGDGALIHLAEAQAPNELVCQQAAPGYPALGTRACALTIDPVVGERSFTIVNRGDTTLFIDSVVFVDGDPGFTLLSVERELEPEERGDVVIGFQPTSSGSAVTSVHIGSNAVNEPVVVVDVVAAAGACTPALDVSPERCDFGVVGVGDVGLCALSFVNSGACEVLISAAGFTDETPLAIDVEAGALQIPTLVPVGDSVAVLLSARPTDTSTSTGAFFVELFGGGRIEVPVSATGSDACVGRVARVNGVEINGAPVIEARDEIELSSDRSVPRAGGTIASVAWTFLAVPASSSATLSSPNAAYTALRVDVAGAYRVGLTVTDDLGAVSSCGIDLDVQPARPSVSVGLSTSVPAGDLHVVRAGVDLCGADDCFAGNPAPDWGDADPVFAANGSQSVISFRAAPDEDYTVGVGRLDGTATVRVFVDDQLEFEAVQALAGGQEWLPLRIEVRDGVAALIELNDTSEQPGACFEP